MKPVACMLFLSALGLAVVCEAQTITLHVVDRGEMDASVAGVDVRVTDSAGKQVHEGITDGNGELSFLKPPNKSVTIQYEKLGYIRKPETIAVTVGNKSNKITGPLVRTGGDSNYYARVGRQIQTLLQAVPASERARIENEELGRVQGLSAAVQESVLASMSGDAAGQTKALEVLAVNGNDLVVKLPEGTREIRVPDDFRFTVDGQQLAARDLKVGMKGTASVTTKTTVTPVVVTEVKNGEVMQSSGSSLLVRTDQGMKMFTEGDVERRGIKMMKDGAPAQFSDFHSGDRLSATIVTTHPPKVMTQVQVSATLAKAAPASGASGAAAASASRSSWGSAAPSASRSTSGSASAAPAGWAKKLPKTGSDWPLLALASMLSLVTGLALTIARRSNGRVGR